MAGKEEEYNPIKKHSHNTVKFTSELCQRLNVENVILSHTVDTDLANREKYLLKMLNNILMAMYLCQMI